MDKVWLRDYEKMLSSNRRRGIDVRPMSADISNNRVKKGRPKKIKKRTDNFTSEGDVAQQILNVGTHMDEYDRHFPEKEERMIFQQKLDDEKKKKSSSNTIQISFKKLATFNEFVDVEQKKEECFMTGDSAIFRTLYPEVALHRHHPARATTTSSGDRARPQSSPVYRRSTDTRSGPLLPYQVSCAADSPGTSHSPAPQPPHSLFKLSVAQRALDLWRCALTSLRSSGQTVVYDDLSRFSRRWKRSRRLGCAAAYISVLLGLKSGDLAATQRSVFRELYSLLKFFREANPLTLPRRRVAKANIYYLNTMAPLRGVHVPQSSQGEGGRDDSLESTILGWVDAMQATLSIILDAKQRHDILTANFEDTLLLDEGGADRTGGKRGSKATRRQQQQHRRDELSPAGCWSTRLTTPEQMRRRRPEEERSLQGLSAFDSMGVASLLEVSPSATLPLEDLMSLEYTPDKDDPATADKEDCLWYSPSPSPGKNNNHNTTRNSCSSSRTSSGDAYEEYVTRCSHSSPLSF